jgi:hypothetical protein
VLDSSFLSSSAFGSSIFLDRRNVVYAKAFFCFNFLSIKVLLSFLSLLTHDHLQKEFDNIGLEAFIKHYKKYDCLLGPSESFRFLEEKQKEYELQSLQVVDKRQKEKTIEA